MSQLAEVPATLRQPGRCPTCGTSMSTRVPPPHLSRRQVELIAADTIFLNPLRRVLRCDACESHDVVRCRRTRLERWVLNALGMWTFVCRKCQARYYAPKWTRRSPEAGEE